MKISSQGMLDSAAHCLDKLDNAAKSLKSLKSDIQSLSTRASDKLKAAPRQMLAPMKASIFQHENDLKSQGALLDKLADKWNAADDKAKEVKADLKALAEKASAKLQGPPKQALGAMKKEIFKHENDRHSQGTMLDKAADALQAADDFVGKAAHAVKSAPKRGLAAFTDGAKKLKRSIGKIAPSELPQTNTAKPKTPER